MRWVDPNSADQWRNAFRIDKEHGLVMKSKELAKQFALGFGLLATEHWVHPVHRLQLQLFADMVKGAVLDGPLTAIDNETMHVIDRLYTIDADLVGNMRARGVLNNDLHALLVDIARAQRRIFMMGREYELAGFLRESKRDSEHRFDQRLFPRPLEQHNETEYTGVKPANVEFLPIKARVAEDIKDEVKDFDELPHTLDVFLPAFKSRAIDPPYVDADGNIKHLSDQDAEYAAQLSEIRAIQSQSYVARIYMSPDARYKLVEKIEIVNKEWEERMRWPRTELSTAQLKESLRMIGGLAMGRSSHRILWT